MTSNYQEVADELQVLESVFCKNGEFVLHDFNESSGSARFTITISDGSVDPPSRHPASTLAMTFTIGPDYPQSLPDITLTSDLLTRKTTESLKSLLTEYANEHLLGEPMILQIVECVRLHVKEYANESHTVDQAQVVSHNQSGLMLSLLRLDHMRAKAHYIKTLVSWCAELGIMGRILFVGKLILILLEGQKENVKEFIVRLKTQKVDVDSNGKPCKEKMMSVLSEVQTDDEKRRFSAFEVAELKSTEELREAFHAARLMELYAQHVQPLCRHLSQGSIR